MPKQVADAWRQPFTWFTYQSVLIQVFPNTKFLLFLDSKFADPVQSVDDSQSDLLLQQHESRTETSAS